VAYSASNHRSSCESDLYAPQAYTVSSGTLRQYLLADVFSFVITAKAVVQYPFCFLDSGLALATPAQAAERTDFFPLSSNPR
jgi:hypothetical protein